MTVKELIEELQKYDMENVVYVADNNGRSCSPTEAILVDTYQVFNKGKDYLKRVILIEGSD